MMQFRYPPLIAANSGTLVGTAVLAAMLYTGVGLLMVFDKIPDKILLLMPVSPLRAFWDVRDKDVLKLIARLEEDSKVEFERTDVHNLKHRLFGDVFVFTSDSLFGLNFAPEHLAIEWRDEGGTQVPVLPGMEIYTYMGDDGESDWIQYKRGFFGGSSNSESVHSWGDDSRFYPSYEWEAFGPEEANGKFCVLERRVQTVVSGEKAYWPTMYTVVATMTFRGQTLTIDVGLIDKGQRDLVERDVRTMFWLWWSKLSKDQP